MTRVMARVVINPVLMAKPGDAELIADAGNSFNDGKARELAKASRPTRHGNARR